MYVLETRLPFFVYLFPLCISEPSVVTIFWSQKNYFGQEWVSLINISILTSDSTPLPVNLDAFPYCQGIASYRPHVLPDHFTSLI